MVTGPAPAAFRPMPGMGGRHRQTLFGPLFRRTPGPAWTLEMWPTPDDDHLRVHLAVPDDAPAVAVLFHGLEGSVDAPYIAGLARRLRAAGLGVVAMEHRGCGAGPLNRAPRLYHLGVTDDLSLVVHEVARRFSARPVLLAGYSAGANMLAKWLGQCPDDVPDAVRAAAVVSAPFDLTVTGPHLDQVLGGFYTRVFLRTLIPKALAKAAQYPGTLDVDRIRAAKTFVAFDTYATAALHGFDDAAHYWQSVGCGQFLAGIRVPTLLLSAADDPFNPAETLPHDVAARSPALRALFPAQGGHVGFVGGRLGRPSYWGERQVHDFLLDHAMG